MIRRERPRTKAVVGLEALEGRKVLSSIIVQPGFHVVPIGTTLTHCTSYLQIQGTLQGSATHPKLTNPDSSPSVKLAGSGTLHNLGHAKVAGTLYGTGFINNGHVNGTLTLSTGKGSLTLHLEGPTVPSFTQPGSGTYPFDSTSGTGSLRHTFARGTVDLMIGPKSFTLTFHGGPNVY